MTFFFLQAEDGIRDLRMSRGLGDVYKRQVKVKGMVMVKVKVKVKVMVMVMVYPIYL